MKLYRMDFYSINTDKVMTVLRVSDDKKSLVEEVKKKYRAHPQSIYIRAVNKVNGYKIKIEE